MSLIFALAAAVASALPETLNNNLRYKEFPNLRQRDMLPPKTGSPDATMPLLIKHWLNPVA